MEDSTVRRTIKLRLKNSRLKILGTGESQKEIVNIEIVRSEIFFLSKNCMIQ